MAMDMPDDEKRALIGEFLTEADQHIQKLNECLLRAEELVKSGQAVPKDEINMMFRAAHTIKGAAGMLEFMVVNGLTHEMETILDRARNDKLNLTVQIIDVLFRAFDSLNALLDRLREQGTEDVDVSGAIALIKSVLEGGAAPTEAPAAPAEAAQAPAATGAPAPLPVSGPWNEYSEVEKYVWPYIEDVEKNIERFNTLLINLEEGQFSADLIGELFRISHTIKGSSGVLKRPDVESVAHKMEDRLSVLRDANTPPDAGLLRVLFKGIDAIKQIIADLRAGYMDLRDVSAVIHEIVTGVPADGQSPAETPVAAAPPAAPAAAPASPAPVPAAPAAAAKPAAKAAAGAPAAKSGPVEVSTMRVDSQKLDILMNLAGELVITRARFAQIVNEISQYQHGSQAVSLKDIETQIYNLDEATGLLGKLSSDIQASVMQTRMVPIEGVFSRFKRVVRDIAKDVGKDLVLELVGEETELDKKIIDELGDPLMHMVRNACDHGLERPEDRLKVGKPAQGKVTLSALHKGNNICIRIADDGRGMDAERIVAKAVEKGVVTQEQGEQMTTHEKLQLIFAPGFSTAEKVTGLSGRGVGMDVVKKMIESLKGTVDIDTVLGKGSTFTLKIPLTLAIIQALLVVIHDEVFALPLEGVSEIIKIRAKEIYSVDGCPTVKLRGHALSLVDLEDILQIKTTPYDGKSDRRVVVVTDGDHKVGVPVDRLIGEDEIVIKSLSEHFASVRGVSGASILGNGQLALILDVATILREAQ